MAWKVGWGTNLELENLKKTKKFYNVLYIELILGCVLYLLCNLQFTQKMSTINSYVSKIPQHLSEKSTMTQEKLKKTD